MKKLYVSQSLIDVESRKELLDQAEIPCMIKNQRSAMLGGEVPFVEVFPELWVLQDDDLERAQQFLEDQEGADLNIIRIGVGSNLYLVRDGDHHRVR